MFDNIFVFETSVTVTVWLPTVFNWKVPIADPLTKEVLFGMIASPSEVVNLIESPGALTGFQWASTALTVTVTRSPALTGVGVPVLPVGVPGAAVSPGNRTCNWVKVRLIKAKNAVLPAGKLLAGINTRRPG